MQYAFIRLTSGYRNSIPINVIPAEVILENPNEKNLKDCEIISFFIS